MARPNPDDFKKKYFAEIAPDYANVTGNATQDVFVEFLKQYDLKITDDSVIHDNGAGPGTATEVLVSQNVARGIKPQIIATDYSDAMIDALEKIKASSKLEGWQTVETKVCDSASLDSFADGFFTHSINNMSLATFTTPIPCLKETYRTLRPGGFAVVTAWKRFAASDLLSAAQAHVKGAEWAAQHPVPVNGPEYFQEGYMAKQLAEVGFDGSKIQNLTVKHILKPGKYWDGFYKFLAESSIAKAATRGWSEDETQKWPEGIEKAIQQEKDKFGGILFEGWISVATK